MVAFRILWQGSVLMSELPEAVQQARARGPRSPLPVLMLTALLGTMAVMSFIAVVGPLVRSLGLSEWHAGLSVTAAGVLWMLSARRWGRLSDRVGRRRVLMTGLAVFAAIYLLMAVMLDAALQSAWSVLVCALLVIVPRALAGVFYAAIPTTTTAWIADEIPPQARASAMAKIGGANAIGMVFGPAAVGWMAFHNLAWALYAAAAMPFLALLAVVLRLPYRPPVKGTASTTPGAAEQGGAMPSWRDQRLRLPVWTAGLAMTSVSIGQVVVGFFAIDRLNLTPEEGARVAGLALTAVGCGLLCAQGLVMRMKSIPPARWIALGALLSAIGFASVSLIAHEWQLLAGYALAAFGMGFVFPSFQALAANSVKAHEQGAAAGTVSSMLGFGTVIGPMIGTVLYRLWPSAPYILIGVVLLGLALAAALQRNKDA